MNRRRLPPLNALVAFEAAARHCNYTRAAGELSVAQPAVTRHIHNLEAWVGAALFLREGNRVSLTPRGAEMAELATVVLDRLEIGLRPLTVMNDHELRIGASFGITHLWLMPRITAMRAAAQTTINFLTSDNYRDFDVHSVDVSIRFGNGQFGSLSRDLLFAETCQIIASPAFLDAHPGFDPLRLAQTIAPQQMFDHGDPQARDWMTWRALAERTGQTLPSGTSFQKVASYPTMLDMISAGEGIGIGYWGLEDQMVADGKIVRVGPRLGRPDCGYYLVYSPDMLSNGRFKKLRDYLIANGGLRRLNNS